MMITLVLRLFCGNDYVLPIWSHIANFPHQHKLRSASTEQIDIPFFRQSTVGDRAFPVAGAKVWNSTCWRHICLTATSFQWTDWKSSDISLTWSYLSPQYSGPCNSFNCLGHCKNLIINWLIDLFTHMVCHLHVAEMSGVGESTMSRRKSFKKSLRESFRRLRSRRSDRRRKTTVHDDDSRQTYVLQFYHFP